MKYLTLLLVILVLVFQKLNAQIRIDPVTSDTLKILMKSKGWGESDTIRVVMLCSDTTKQKYPGANKLRKADGYTVEIANVDKYRVPLAWWMFGYLVKRFPVSYNWMPIYLDDKKKPIRQGVVVWQAIDTNPIQLAF